MIDLYLSFVLGLAAGLHCLGMCGPIVLALQKPVVREWMWAGNLLYNLGRILTYGLAGLALSGLVHSASGFLPTRGWRIGISLAVNGVLLLVGLFLLLPVSLKGLNLPGPHRIPGFARLAAWSSGRGSLAACFLLGLLLGLLPCTPSYAVILKAADAPSPLWGFLTPVAFGLGTAPWLLFVGITTRSMQARARRWGEILSGAVIVAMAAVQIARVLVRIL